MSAAAWMRCRRDQRERSQTAVTAGLQVARGRGRGSVLPAWHWRPKPTAPRRPHSAFLGLVVVAETRRLDSRPREPSTRGRGALLPTLPDQTGRAKRGLGRNRRASRWRLSRRSPSRALAGRSAAVRSSGHSLRNWGVSSGSCHVSARPGRS